MRIDLELTTLAFLLMGFALPHATQADEGSVIPPLLTKEAAETIVEVGHLIQKQADNHHKASLLQEPALDVFAYDPPGQGILLRQLAPQPWTRPLPPPRTEETSGTKAFEAPKLRSIHLGITVFDHQASELVWRQNGETYTAISNVDFNHLTQLGSFEQGGVTWQFLCFVQNIDSEQARKLQQRALDAGREIDLRTEPDISMLDAVRPDYAVYAHDASTIPDEMIEALNALHAFYAANRTRLEVQWKNARTLEEARRTWNEANPPATRETVINFWVRP